MQRLITTIFLLGILQLNAEVKSIEEAIKQLSATENNPRETAKQYLWAHYPQSVKALKKAKNTGDPEVLQLITAIFNRFKKGDVPENLYALTVKYAKSQLSNKQLVTQFTKFSEAGDARASMWLARIHFRGRCGVKANPELGQKMAKKVITKISEMASAGDMVSQFLLGSAYGENLGVKYDLEKSAKWYSEAVQADDILSLNNFALMLLHGHGVDPDYKRAIKFLKKGNELGCKFAEKNLAQYSKNHDPIENKRMAFIRKNNFARVLGMKYKDALTYLADKKLLSRPDIVNTEIRYFPAYRACNYFFIEDGIYLKVNEVNNRVITVEAYNEGVKEYSPFRGTLPKGLNWDDTAESALQKLGSPNSSGSVTSDRAYGMAYDCGNITFAVMFARKGPMKLKIFRAFENWAVKYPDLEKK